MLDGLREEKPTSIAGARLIIDPSEQILVQEIEQEEGCKREAINDGGYNRVAERDYNE